MSVREFAAGDIVESVDYDGFPVRLRIVRIDDLTALLKVMAIETGRCRELFRTFPKDQPRNRLQVWSGPVVWIDAADVVEPAEDEGVTQAAA